MAKRRGKWTVSGVLAALMGFLCAVALGALFYGTMVYQLAGEESQRAQQTEQTGGVLALNAGTLIGETQTQEEVGGALCTVIMRSYQLEGGRQARAITAAPAAYLERLTAQGVAMQLITGFVIDDLDAVYALAGETGILAARSGDTVYMIEGNMDQQALYAIGAGARRNTEE